MPQRQPISSNPAPRPAADPDGYVTRPRWLWRELDWHRGLAANTLAALFVIVTVAWIVSSHWPGLFDVRPVLANHFGLTPENLSAGRHHCTLTHAFLSIGTLPHTLLTFVGLVVFGYAAERRIGTIPLLIVFGVATVAGGMAELAAGSVGGHALVDHITSRAGSAAQSVADVLTRLLHGRSVVTGPAAAITAFLVVAVMIRPDDDSRWDNAWLALVGVALIVADSRAILGEAAGGAINASRFVGVMVGLLTVVIRAILTRDFGPSRSAQSAAVGRLALPVAAMIAVSTAPAFTPTDFLETCFWLERVAWPVESELSPTEAAIRQEHRHRIERTLTEIKNRPVSWAVPAGRASGHEVRLVHRYLVNAGWVQAVPDDPNALSLLRRANERMDIAVVLSAGPAENLAVPLTPELLAFGQHFPGQPIPLSATVERIEFEDPESDEHWQGLVRGIFRIHLTGVTTRLGTSH